MDTLTRPLLVKHLVVAFWSVLHLLEGFRQPFAVGLQSSNAGHLVFLLEAISKGIGGIHPATIKKMITFRTTT
jgi:hypothetical protein